MVVLLAMTLLAFFRPAAQPTPFSNPAAAGLTFAERVAYQRAIEEVYWRHRIWPKENRSPKPSLDAVMSQTQLEKKVADYLRESQALEDYWQRPITPEQLQAEMDRMAQHTKEPEVLRELFEALGNDPFVIAECLARPALAERLAMNSYAYDERIHSELKQRIEAELQAHPAVQQVKQLSGRYSEIELIKRDSTEGRDNRNPERGLKLNDGEWSETFQKLATAFSGSTVAEGVSPAREQAVVVSAPAGELTQMETGILSRLQEDKTHYYVTAVIEATNNYLVLGTVSWPKEPLDSWLAKTENQVRIATGAPGNAYRLPTLAAGGCTDDTWTPTSVTNAPDARDGHTAVWTGSEMIVWGGIDFPVLFNTGGRYNPSTDSWAALSTADAPDPRYLHTAVWTGSEMIVWGGGGNNALNTGGRYNPSTDSWTATSTAGAPVAREYHTAVWSGTEMIVWAGIDGGDNPLNTGGRYAPSTDSWTATSLINAPDARYLHTAVWTGSEMIVWGGGYGYLNSGGRYNPSTDSWAATSTAGAPAARKIHTAVWTGSEMIVWGGLSFGSFVNTGGRYNPSTDGWMATSTSGAPAGRELHTAVWTGSEMIVWGGDDPSYLNTGGRYNPAADSWIATNTAGASTDRELHTAVWTGSEMIVWGGYNGNVFNSGGRYCAQLGPPLTPTPTATATATVTPTPTRTPTVTPSVTPTATPTATPTITASATPTPTATATATLAQSPTPRITTTPRSRPTSTARPTPPARLTPPPTPSGSPRPTPEPRP